MYCTAPVPQRADPPPGPPSHVITFGLVEMKQRTGPPQGRSEAQRQALFAVKGFFARAILAPFGCIAGNTPARPTISNTPFPPLLSRIHPNSLPAKMGTFLRAAPRRARASKGGVGASSMTVCRSSWCSGPVPCPFVGHACPSRSVSGVKRGEDGDWKQWSVIKWAVKGRHSRAPPQHSLCGAVGGGGRAALGGVGTGETESWQRFVAMASPWDEGRVPCPPSRDALEAEGPQRRQRRLDRRLEEVAKTVGAVTVGYKCH